MWCSPRDSAGEMGASCSGGTDLIDGRCYEPCPNNYVRVGTTCAAACPLGFTQNGLVCVRNEPQSYSRGTGYTTEEECICANGECQQEGDKWYSYCIQGYSPSVVPGQCSRTCPDGTNSLVCKQSTVQPASTTTSLPWSTIAIIAVVLIILVLVVAGMANSYKPDITGIIMGDPGKDAYSKLQSLTLSRGNTGEMIYI